MVREESGAGEMVELVDPLSGETVKVRRPSITERRETVRRALVNPPALDTPGNTVRDAWKLMTSPDGGRPTLGQHAFWSTFRILLGFLISALVAVPLGVAMGLFPRLRAAVSPIISFLRPLPSIAWVPLALIWLGAGEAQKLAIIFMGSFSAALLYTVEATLKVDPNVVRAARNLGVGERQMLTKVLLPAALPNILSGLKVVMAIGWTCVISAEIVGTQKGLGSLIWNSREISKTSWVLVGMVSISALVLVFDALFNAIERRLLPWVFRK
ncbi:MAG: ABC transporter permease [Planctomycetota bacterium]